MEFLCSHGLQMKQVKAHEREVAKNEALVTFEKGKDAPILNRVMKSTKQPHDTVHKNITKIKHRLNKIMLKNKCNYLKQAKKW